MRSNKLSNLLSLLFLVATLGVAVYAAFVNDTIVVHWGPLGGSELQGMSYLILFLPLLSAALYLLLRKGKENPFALDPKHDMPQTQGNAQQLRRYVDVLSLGVTGLLLYITLCAAGFLPMIPLVVMLVVAFFIIYYARSRRKLRGA
ncbi:hypothetical protein [Prevotella sp. oral taxon 317]|jgi:hypothetical protein|uniref:hypothetical protein n=1 Tax=Prevotella sp. oral taxon 317 TaxID=652721 RepID=UPI0001C4011C|nr:hypothetical protein [Prevotella sp. oral taxon 317]EFC68430.1 hypothetical protein HMPREF0670_01601 [Prevotella sp. oral taxon 317 str. F0108]